MSKTINLLATFVCGLALQWPAAATQAEPCPRFSAGRAQGRVVDETLSEISGVAASRQNPGVLWVHNDSGNSPLLYALREDGSTRAIYAPTKSSNIDWEDIAIGPGPEPGRDYLYLGDIGDNKRSRDSITVYRSPEPRLPQAQKTGPTPLTQTVALRLSYSDGSHNAETLFVDPQTGDLYIVTKDKKTGKSGLYKAAYPQAESGVSPMQRVASLIFEGDASARAATGGDISADGSEILIRTFSRGYLWRRAPGHSIGSSLQTEPCPVPIASEPQGEAIAFTPDGLHYLTLSEKVRQPIHRHERGEASQATSPTKVPGTFP